MFVLSTMREAWNVLLARFMEKMTKVRNSFLNFGLDRGSSFFQMLGFLGLVERL